MQPDSSPTTLSPSQPFSWKVLILTGVTVSLLVGIGGAIVLTTHMDPLTFISSLSTRQITATDLQQGALKPVILIDVRTPAEYQEDHIGESVLVPLDEIETGNGVQTIETIARAAQNNPTPPTLVLYCTSGMRSVKAYKKLEATGLKLVVLQGGIKHWRRSTSRERDMGLLRSITVPVKLPF
ncbi:MAG: rhodanese-like domain-containing protein [Leptolyngbyaceae cyanobacterium bins.59]|nr:rhodanese-like domain-containing protein [Leptolyngbyaceae cyanobacterium bins.59]